MKQIRTFSQDDLKLESILIENNYLSFLEYCNVSNDGERLVEGKLWDLIKEKISFIKNLAIELGFKIVDLVKVFKDKVVFAFFSFIKWDLGALKDIVVDGINLYKKIVNFVPDLMTKLVVNGKVVQNLRDSKTIKIVSEWVEKHKGLLMAGSFALAGLMLLSFVYGHATGDISSDFDLSDILNALLGKINIVNFLISEEGISMLVFLFMGTVIPNFGLYATVAKGLKFLNKTSFMFVLGFITTIAKKLGIRLGKGKTTDSDIEDLQKA